MAANPQMLIRIAANLSQLKANLAEGKNQIEITTAACAKLANSLDGSKLDQRAHNITAAIHAIGGATKLTDAEALRHLKTLDAWIDKANRIGKEVPADILKTRDALVRTNAELVKTPTLAEKAGGFLKSTFAQFTLAGLATQAISKLTTELSAFVATGMKLPAVEQSYKRLTSAMGVDGKMMLANMTTSTRGMVANYDLMIGANKAMLLGLPVTAASMGDLAKTATILGKAMGQDATKSLDDLITALGRSSPMILDNLGLSVKVGEANEEYARKLGKTSEQLTEAEKKMAFYNAAMEAARKKTAELGDQTRTLGDIATTVWTQIGNVVTTMSARVNVGLGSILSSQKNFIQYLKDFAAYGNAWDAITAASIRAAHKVGTDVNLAVEKVAETTVKGAKTLKTYKAAIEEVIALTPEQIQVNNLLAKAKIHEKSQVDFAASAWKAWENTVSTALKNVEKNSAPLKLIARDLSGLVPQIGGAASGGGNMAGYVPPKPGLLEQMFGTKDDIGKYFKSSFGDLSGMLSGVITGGMGVGTALKGYATNVAKDFAASALSMIPGIGPILSQFAGPIIDGLKKAFGSIFGIGTAGRDLVKDFAGTFGGFDTLHAILGKELPADSERLWIALTQGVGRNNPGEAKKAIDAITAALEAQKGKTAELAQATADTAAVQQTALAAISAKYDDIIGKLKGELGSFSASLQAEADAPEFDEMGTRIYGVVELQQMARKANLDAEIKAQEIMRDTEIAAKQEMFAGMLTAGQQVDAELRTLFGRPLEIPYYFSAQNTPGGGGSSSGGGSSRSSDASQTIVVQVDGEVLTRAVVNTSKRHGAA